MGLDSFGQLSSHALRGGGVAVGVSAPDLINLLAVHHFAQLRG